MRFIATEIGFEEGMGGASNAASEEEYHYLAFGLQEDPQQPGNSAIYFEFDDQSNGDIDRVVKVVVGARSVDFVLREGRTIGVDGRRCEPDWAAWVSRVREVFGQRVVEMVGE